jgi:hypothetical protein
MAGSKSSAPGSAAEGLGNVLRAITDTMQAPDAVQFAGPLMHLQTTVLDMIHGHGQGQKQGQQAPGGQGQPGQPPGPGAGGPPGAGAPPGAGGALAGGLSGMMGQPQGPSKATSGGGPSLSGMDPEEMRETALVGADQG